MSDEVLVTYQFKTCTHESKTKILTLTISKEEQTEYNILKLFYETIWLSRLETLERFYIEGKEYIIPQTFTEEIKFEDEMYMILMEYILSSKLAYKAYETADYYQSETIRLKEKLDRLKFNQNINSL